LLLKDSDAALGAAASTAVAEVFTAAVASAAVSVAAAMVVVVAHDPAAVDSAEGFLPVVLIEAVGCAPGPTALTAVSADQAPVASTVATLVALGVSTEVELIAVRQAGTAAISVRRQRAED
jgi:hypothetical protein